MANDDTPFQFQAGDKVRLEGTILSTDGYGIHEVAFKSGYPVWIGPSDMTLVERPKRPVKNGDRVLVQGRHGVFVGMSINGTAVVNSSDMYFPYDGYDKGLVTHLDGTEILWDNS
jgi:hypothetical protein